MRRERRNGYYCRWYLSKDGKQNITSASRESGVVANFGFDESLMYEAWNNISLKKLPGLPIYKPEGGITVLMNHLSDVMRYYVTADYYVFPVQVKAESLNDVVYPEFINPIEKVNHDVYDLKKMPVLKKWYFLDHW